MQNQCYLNFRSKCILNALRIHKGTYSHLFHPIQYENSNRKPRYNKLLTNFSLKIQHYGKYTYFTEE